MTNTEIIKLSYLHDKEEKRQIKRTYIKNLIPRFKEYLYKKYNN